MSVRPLAFAAMLALVGGCRARQVEVRTSATPVTGLSIQVNNKLNQAVNVYVTATGSDTPTFLGQAAANNTTTLPVQGFSAGATVSLRAVPVDGSRTYSRANVVLNGMYPFPVP